MSHLFLKFWFAVEPWIASLSDWNSVFNTTPPLATLLAAVENGAGGI